MNFSMRGTPNTIKFPVTTGVVTAIEPGDLLWFNGTTLNRMGGATTNNIVTWVDEFTETRMALGRFAGIADFSYNTIQNLHTEQHIVKSGYVTRMTCTSATYHAGDFVGPSKDSGGNYLKVKNVVKKQDPREAIGFVVKDYTAAATELEVYVCSAYDMQNNLRSLLGVLSVLVPSAVYITAGDPLINYNFPGRVRVLAAEGIVNIATTGEHTGTLYKGAQAMTQTHVIATGQALGSQHYQVLAHATDITGKYYDFDYNEDFDYVCDHTPTVGGIQLNIEFCHLPLII
jgi:hypothetical protein